MENSEQMQGITTAEINTIIQKAVNEAIAPLIAGIEDFKANPTGQKDDGDGISEAVKQYVAEKRATQPVTTQEAGISDATAQWLRHKKKKKEIAEKNFN